MLKNLPRGLSPGPLARQSARRPWTVIAIWVLLFIVAGGLRGTLFDDVITTKFEPTSDPESHRADKLLEERLTGPKGTNEVIIVQSETLTVDDAAFRGFVEGLFADVAALGPEIIRGGSFTNYYQSRAEFLVSQERRTTIMPFTMAGDLDDASDNIETVVNVVDKAKNQSQFHVLMTGQATVGLDFREVADKGLRTGEAFGIPIALVILVLVLGAVLASVIPLILAAFSIVLALGIASLVGQAFELSFFIENMITMIGLAVGIDYSLFVIARYREERARGFEKIDAIERAGGTATRAVIFSGMTVVLALIGMLLVPSNVFIALGMGAIFVVIAAVLGSMTLLPAVLSLLGDKINLLSIPWIGRAQARFDESRPGGFWDRLSRAVMRQPVISLVLAAGVLVAAAIAFFSINTGASGISTMPDGLESKEGILILDEKFSAGVVTPAEIVIDGDVNAEPVQAGIQRLKGVLEADAAFSRPRPLRVDDAHTLALLSVPLAGDPATKETQDAIVRLRDQYIPDAFREVPADVLVTGETAVNIDSFHIADNAAKVVIPFVLAVSLILLTIVFRSIVVPIKAIILNILSVGATYGILVLIFQKGVLNETFGFQQSETIEAWIPIFLFAVLFGLSMDYHVFLLSRIRERFDQTQDNTASVAFGIRSTGRLITGAALIMVAVFWGFSAGDLVGLQQMGFGLGIAVLLDATIVRVVLVPSSMRLLGKWNWYLPSWLGWMPDLRPDLRVDVRREGAGGSPSLAKEPAGGTSDS